NDYSAVSVETGQFEPQRVGVEVTDSGIARLRSTLRLNWSFANWAATWSMRYTSALTEDCAAPAATSAQTPQRFRQPHARRQRQVVGDRVRQRPQLFDRDARRRQDVVDRASRLPAWIGRDGLPGRRHQRRLAEQCLEFLAVCRAVEVAHEHRMALLADEFGDERQLAFARGRPERQMCHHEDQFRIAIAEAHPQRAAAWNASRQRIVENFLWFD